MKSLWCCALCVAVLPFLSVSVAANSTTAVSPATASVPQNQAYSVSVKQFLAADFDGQVALLQHWPSSPESLKQFMVLLENDALYYNDQGQPYELDSTGQVLDLATQKPIGMPVESLQSYSANNSIRSLIEAHRANDDLTSSDASVRLDAATILLENALAANDALIAQQLKTETDPQIQALLVRIQNQKDLSSSSLQRQLKAAKDMASSSDPEVMALIDSKLSEDGAALSPELKSALQAAKSNIATRIKMSEYAGYAFSGISLGSILLLAALGLAITYGLLGVINMAHGELIMIGAYSTYVVQNLFVSYAPEYLGWYLIAAIPTAFMVTALIGVIIERIIIKPLYGRQLETLLATFGVSLILMQLMRMIFGAQNVEVANVSWLSGGLAISPSLTLPYSRIAIIGFTLAVLAGLYFMISKTRLGLFIRAVTQNRQMAKAVGVRSDRVDMLAFGLGSGLAGLAGCALSQITNVGPDLGQNYIIDAFLVVVVGGVGQLPGATIAAFTLGVSSKMFEVMMGAVLAKILLLALIILFIQKRPQGLFAIKGRFVE